MQHAPDSDDRHCEDHVATLRAAGASEEHIAAWVRRYRAEMRARAPRRPRSVKVEPVNWPAVEVWMRVHRQWRLVAGMGMHYLGLDATAVWATLAAMGRAGDVDTFDRVMVIGDQVARLMNERMREASNDAR